MRPAFSFDEVLFVIVLYQQRLSQTRAYSSLQSIFHDHTPPAILVYDNTALPAPVEKTNVNYCHDEANSGVSRAYNVAIHYAKNLGLRYLFLLDQDSELSPDALSAYSRSVRENPGIHVFAPTVKHGPNIMSPFTMNYGRGAAAKNMIAGRYSFDRIFIVNAGLLVSTEAFEASGGYDEKFPLDFSDIIFCSRLLAKKYDWILVDTIVQQDHSSFSRDAIHARRRFRKYVQALSRYRSLQSRTRLVWVGGFYHSLNLSRRFRSLWFLTTFLFSR